MEGDYYQFQIFASELNLPERSIPDKITICNLSDVEEFNGVLDLFFTIFPDEIDSKKGRDLRDMQISESEGTFLAKLGRKIIGFLVTGIINHVGYISYIGVSAEHRSQGIATALLKRFKDYLQAQNVKKIRCKIRKDNQKTLDYINHLGFKEFSTFTSNSK